jgi:hypothetical protein
VGLRETMLDGEFFMAMMFRLREELISQVVQLLIYTTVQEEQFQYQDSIQV